MAGPMDASSSVVIYLDNRAYEDEHLQPRGHHQARLHPFKTESPFQKTAPNHLSVGRPRDDGLQANLSAMLAVFPEGLVCLTKVTELDENRTANTSIILLIDVPYEQEQEYKRRSRETRTPSPHATRRDRTPDRRESYDLYGIEMLRHIATQIQEHSFSRPVLPVVLVSGAHDEPTSASSLSASPSAADTALFEQMRTNRYLEAGAIDVLSSPASRDRLQGLTAHVFRTQKEFAKAESNFLAAKRARKLSWVGVDETKPYAYMREAMVSGLMSNICKPHSFQAGVSASDIELPVPRHAIVRAAVPTWAFSAHQFSDDELLYGALLMLEHALTMPELARWKITTDEIVTFLLASRKAYNEFVLYHNFRHVIDVLQATFCFLLHMGALPPFPNVADVGKNPSPVCSVVKPFDTLMLLISAIGHDVGHPGVNNAFLVALNAPLAQLYNDKSVLESFHCAAYSQILRRYWPSAFNDTQMRKLMINTILATDMGVHFQYMTEMAELKQKLTKDDKVSEWSDQDKAKTRDLVCGLVIKCADISNVARKFETAAQWAAILTEEFASQGRIEEELSIPSCLFGGPPVLNDVIKMGESQIGFMKIFARPLFEGVSGLIPSMYFTVDEMKVNNTTWENKIKAENERRATESSKRSDSQTPNSSPPPPPPPQKDLQHKNKSEPALPNSDSRNNLAEMASGTEQPNPSAANPADIAKAASHSPEANSTLMNGLNMDHKSDPLVISAAQQPGVASQNHRGDSPQQQYPVEKMKPSGPTNTHVSNSRRGSADASLTTILVKEQGSQSGAPDSPQRTPVATKSHSSTKAPPSSSHSAHPSNGCSSVPSYPSSHSQAASSVTNTQPYSPTTDGTSFIGSDTGLGSPVDHGPDPFGGAPDESAERFSSTSDLPTPRNKPHPFTLHHRNDKTDSPPGKSSPDQPLRTSRSRGRLRGLKFWKAPWKSPVSPPPGSTDNLSEDRRLNSRQSP